MDVSANGRVFTALGHCGPMLVISAKAAFRLASFWRNKKNAILSTLSTSAHNVANHKRYLFTGL